MKEEKNKKKKSKIDARRQLIFRRAVLDNTPLSLRALRELLNDPGYTKRAAQRDIDMFRDVGCIIELQPNPKADGDFEFVSVEGPHTDEIAIRAKTNYARESVKQTQECFFAKASAIARLRALVDEYAKDNTITIHPRAVSTAERFLRALPDGVSLPEFSIEPDGSIALDWMESPNRLFSLSVGDNNRFACAWLDGTNKGHFVENFDGPKIPDRIIVGITSILKNGYAVLRAT